MKRIAFIFILIWHPIFLSFSGGTDYNHSFSGTKFETNIGSFIIISPKIYDEKGKDIGVGYRSPTLIELTHYIYPQGDASLKDHFNEYKKSLLSNKSWAKCIHADEIMTSKIAGYFAKFNFNDDFHGKNQLINSYLYMYESKGWFIMLRITCDTTNSLSKEQEIKEYLKIMPWPTKENK